MFIIESPLAALRSLLGMACIGRERQEQDKETWDCLVMWMEGLVRILKGIGSITCAERRNSQTNPHLRVCCIKIFLRPHFIFQSWVFSDYTVISEGIF